MPIFVNNCFFAESVMNQSSWHFLRYFLPFPDRETTNPGTACIQNQKLWQGNCGTLSGNVVN